MSLSLIHTRVFDSRLKQISAPVSKALQNATACHRPLVPVRTKVLTKVQPTLTQKTYYLGGYFAITLTDFIQGIIMIIGSVVMVMVLVGKGGGIEKVLSTI